VNRKADILAEIERSRMAIRRDFRSVRTELDVAEHVRRSVKKRPLAWLGSAAVLGYFFAGPRTRTRTVTKYVPDAKAARKAERQEKHKPGKIATLLRVFQLVSPLVRPALTAYATRRLGELASRYGK
jgi:hypothetical protein